MSARVCSATLTLFPPGVFITRTPRCVAASTSILSIPTPARPTTRRRSALSSSSRVTRVALRTIRPSALASSVGSAAAAGEAISQPVSRSNSSPRSLILSATIIFMATSVAGEHRGVKCEEARRQGSKETRSRGVKEKTGTRVCYSFAPGERRNGLYRADTERLDRGDEREGRAAVERAADDEVRAEEQGNREGASAGRFGIAAGAADDGEAAAGINRAVHEGRSEGFGREGSEGNCDYRGLSAGRAQRCGSPSGDRGGYR